LSSAGKGERKCDGFDHLGKGKEKKPNANFFEGGRPDPACTGERKKGRREK